MCKNKKCLFFAHSQCHTLCNQSFSIHWYICQWACWRLKLFSANTWNSKPSLTAENVKFATKGWFNGIPSHRRVLMLVVSQIEPAWQAVRIRPLTQGWHHNHTLRAPVICFECPLRDKKPKSSAWAEVHQRRIYIVPAFFTVRCLDYFLETWLK